MLKSIKIKNFRNIKYLDSILSDTGNLIVAPNGSGKTNFIESIYYTIHGKTFRPISNYTDLIRFERSTNTENNSRYYRVLLYLDYSTKIVNQESLEDGVNPVNLSHIGNLKSLSDIANMEDSEASYLQNSPNTFNIGDQLEALGVIDNLEKFKRNFLLNGKRIRSKNLAFKYPLILFAPNSIDLILGDPSQRRLDLDDFLEIINKDYAELISKYMRILKNRNALLESIRDGLTVNSNIDFWTQSLVETATKIFIIRKEYFEKIKSNLKNNSLEFFDSELILKYIPCINNGINEITQEIFASILQNTFKENYHKELNAGKTLYGIHKDEYIFELKNENLRYKGSRGQQRLALLAYKLAQLFYFKEISSKSPILLLDDVLSEIDESNSNKVMEIITAIKAQFVITSTDTNKMPSYSLSQLNRINL